MTRRRNHLVSGLVAAAIASLGAAGYLIVRTNQSPPLLDPRQLPMAQPQTRGDTALIGAVGLVEPSSQPIKIGVEISGTVTEMFVAPGATVRRGDALFALNSHLAAASLSQRQQDLAVAAAQLDYARAKRTGFEAQVDAWRNAVGAAQVDLDDARAMLGIADQLKNSGTMPNRDIVQRRNVARGTEAKLAEAQARLRQSEADLALYDEARGGAAIEVEAASVGQARAAVASALTDLELRTVRAPIDATVLQVNLRPGEFAQAGVATTPLLVLGRTKPLHVRVELDEADIPRFSTDMPAVASARGDGAGKFRLQFVRVEPLVVPKRSLTGDSAERVDTRVMQVIYAVLDDGLDLLPGQQLDVFIEPRPGIVPPGRPRDRVPVVQTTGHDDVNAPFSF